MHMLRHNWITRTLWIALAGLLMVGFAAFWWLDNEAQRGISFAAPQQPIPWTAVDQGGINLPGLHLEQPEAISQTLRLAHAAGFHWARVQFPWEDIEIHARGDFRDYRHDYNGDGTTNVQDAISAWDKYDALVASAAAFDIELIVRLDRPPDWARQHLPDEDFRVAQRASDPGATGPPDSYADYGSYVAAVVGRYRGSVRFFQLWNEPNYGHEWNWADPSPADFVRLLEIGATQARAANPEVVLLFPSLTPADGLDWQAMSDLEFLDAVYARGGGQFFDIFSAQLYGLGQPATENRYVRIVKNGQGRLRSDLLWSRPLDSRADVTRVVLLHEIMERHGDADKAVWISEFGWNDWPTPHPFGLPVDAASKARYTVEMMQRARREWPWMGVMNIWFLRPGVAFNPQDPTLGFALINQDWTPTQTFSAVQDYLAAPPEVGPGIYTAAHPALLQDDSGWTLHFWGTEYVAEGAAALKLDGAPAAVSASGLSLVAHVLSGTGPLPTLRIGRSNPWRWAWTVAPLLWLVAMIVVVYQGLIRFARR